MITNETAAMPTQNRREKDKNVKHALENGQIIKWSDLTQDRAGSDNMLSGIPLTYPKRLNPSASDFLASFKNIRGVFLLPPSPPELEKTIYLITKLSL